MDMQQLLLDLLGLGGPVNVRIVSLLSVWMCWELDFIDTSYLGFYSSLTHTLASSITWLHLCRLLIKPRRQHTNTHKHMQTRLDSSSTWSWRLFFAYMHISNMRESNHKWVNWRELHRRRSSSAFLSSATRSVTHTHHLTWCTLQCEK